MIEDNSVFIGTKPAMNYVLAVVTQFNKGSKQVIVKARGKAISRAVDVVEIVRKRFISNLNIDDIHISTESLTVDKKRINVSAMEITLTKKDGEPNLAPDAGRGGHPVPGEGHTVEKPSSIPLAGSTVAPPPPPPDE